MDILNVEEMTRIAVDAAHEQSEALEVIGVTLSAGGGDYVEVLLNMHGCRLPPCQMSLGVFRNMPEPELRAELAHKLQRHLKEHGSEQRAGSRNVDTGARKSATGVAPGEGGHL